MGTVFSLFINFLWVGALGFGGGFGMIPLMKTMSLDNHWVSLAVFDQAIAMGQVTPGPVAISATFIGERVLGPLGAVIATIAVFTPSQVVIVILSHWYEHFKKVMVVQNLLYISLAAVVGLIAGVSVTLGLSLIHDWAAGILTGIIAFLALRVKQIPYWALILGAGTLGAIFFRP